MNEIFQQFQEFRKVLCVCPCCKDIVRVSELQFKVKGPTTKTWLDEYDRMSNELDRKIERFELKEQELRDIATAKGRKAAAKVVNGAIHPSLRALKLDPYDVKPVLHPIDFVVFKGMNKNDSVSEVLLLSKQVQNPQLNSLRGQIKDAIFGKKYEWQVARINDSGTITFE
jgi:predicted Holliday junction resolvase-like endonuclease